MRTMICFMGLHDIHPKQYSWLVHNGWCTWAEVVSAWVQPMSQWAQSADCFVGKMWEMRDEWSTKHETSFVFHEIGMSETQICQWECHGKLMGSWSCISMRLHGWDDWYEMSWNEMRWNELKWHEMRMKSMSVHEACECHQNLLCIMLKKSAPSVQSAHQCHQCHQQISPSEPWLLQWSVDSSASSVLQLGKIIG